MNEFGIIMAYYYNSWVRVDKERKPVVYIYAWDFPFKQILWEIVVLYKLIIRRKGNFRNQENQCQLGMELALHAGLVVIINWKLVSLEPTTLGALQ